MKSLTDLIVNMKRIEKETPKSMIDAIFNIFEPIVYQIVLTTRIDSGTGRASIGIPFTRDVIPSSRIIEAIENDVTENEEAYHFWDALYGEKNAKTDFSGMCNKLVEGNKIKVEIISYDEGVINQNDGNNMSSANPKKPSDWHPRNDPDRHVPYHIEQITSIIDDTDNLENFTGSAMWLPKVVSDIRERTKNLANVFEKELFR